MRGVFGACLPEMGRFRDRAGATFGKTGVICNGYPEACEDQAPWFLGKRLATRPKWKRDEKAGRQLGFRAVVIPSRKGGDEGTTRHVQ